MGKDIYAEFQRGKYNKKISYKWKKHIGLLVVLIVIVVVGYFLKRYIINKNIEKQIIYNVWIEKAEADLIKIIDNGTEKEYKLSSNLENKIESIVADIHIEGKKVTKIVKKPDSISGKLLSIDKKKIEIYEYGKISIDDKLKLYDKENKLDKRKIDDLNVGIENIEYVLEGKKICAIIFNNKEKENTDNIRILIKNSDYSKIFHDTVCISSASRLKVMNIKKNENLEREVLNINENTGGLKKIDYEVSYIEPGSKFELLEDDKQKMNDGERIIIEVENNTTGMMIDSISRSKKGMMYNGHIEVLKVKEGFVIINETNMEDYLTKVVPSEMPESFGLEALKAQAICARTYAYRHLNNNQYKEYGANVDDSTSYQVYNNQEPNNTASEAVNSTSGKILKYNNEIINAYYYSTSSGFTSSDAQTFGSEICSEYLPVKYQSIGNETKEGIDFNVFYNTTMEDCFENKCPWFRWSTVIATEDLNKSINNYLKTNTLNNNILVKENDLFVSKKISSIENIINIEIAKRESSGLVTEIIITGEKKTIKICDQNTIRNILSPINDEILKNDGSISKQMSILPSGYFVIEKMENEYKIKGGGFGHGTGMSQYGAKVLAESGKNYEEILTYYYSGAIIDN